MANKLIHTVSILVIFSITILNSCDYINPPEDIPAYLHIDSFTLEGDYNTVGSLSNNITDVWISIEGDFIGVFELPVTVPVLKEGSHELTLRPGVIENGISNTRIPYPFYQSHKVQLTLVDKEIDTINPTVEYLSDGYTIVWEEDFESSGTSLEITTSSSTDFVRTNIPEEVFEKNYSMRATLYNKNELFEMQTTDAPYDLPRNKATFLEFNYKTDLILAVGYFASNFTNVKKHGFFYLNPTNTWKKIYVNIGNEVLYEENDRNFRFFFGARKDNEDDSSRIFIDNFKLLTLE